MKTLALYLTISLVLLSSIMIGEGAFVKHFAFSTKVYLLLIMIAVITIYQVISIYNLHLKKTLTYIAITIVVALASLSTSKLLDFTYDREHIFEYYILSQNKQFPIMIDPQTRLDKVYIKDKNIYYQYTMTNISKDTINKDLITLFLSDRISHSNTLDRMMLKLTKEKRVLNYIFKDKDDKFLTKVEFK